jgi:hypothetical protein
MTLGTYYTLQSKYVIQFNSEKLIITFATQNKESFNKTVY